MKAGTTEAILHLRETQGILPQDRGSCSLQLLRVIREIQEANLIIQQGPDTTALQQANSKDLPSASTTSLLLIFTVTPAVSSPRVLQAEESPPAHTQPGLHKGHSRPGAAELGIPISPRHLTLPAAPIQLKYWEGAPAVHTTNQPGESG